MIYLAQPYSSPEPAIMEQRFKTGEYITAELMKKKIWVYSPIVACHELAKKHDLPTDFEYWKEFDLHVIERCGHIFALMLEGWQDSRGMYGELSYAQKAGIRVEFINVNLEKLSYSLPLTLKEFSPLATRI